MHSDETFGYGARTAPVKAREAARALPDWHEYHWLDKQDELDIVKRDLKTRGKVGADAADVEVVESTLEAVGIDFEEVRLEDRKWVTDQTPRRIEVHF